MDESDSSILLKTIFILGLMKIIDLNQFLFGAKKGLNQFLW